MISLVDDGDFHTCCLIDGHGIREREQTGALTARLAQAVIAMDGACTGEHGIGLHKRDLLVEEAGTIGASLMRAIKAVLDAASILQPGKPCQASAAALR